MSRRKAGWRIAVSILVIVAVGVAVVSVWRARTPGAEVNLADVVAVALAGVTMVGAVVAWAGRSTRAATPARVADADEAHVAVGAAAQVLAALVERQWRAEARHRLLEDPEPIPVHWQLIADETVMSQSRLITADAELTITGRSDDIAALADAYCSLTRRRLVITGGAGMGKTTLAIQLLLQLLSTRATDQACACEGEVVPVPVLLPVSGWDTSAHPRLQDWLAVRLAADYPALAAPQLGLGAATALAEGGHILAVLDGLDEIPAPARDQMIAALNASLTARDQLILTSRRAEFTTAIRQAGRPLNGAAVIVPKPVTAQAAAAYLTACLPASPSDAWTQVLAALRSRTAPGLTQLAATPLGLWLIRTVYLAPGADPAPLLGPLGGDADTLRAHLLNRLIPALIQARPPSSDPADHFRPRHRLDPTATRRYLTYLARAFPPATTRDITWWRIARTTPHLRPAVGLVLALVLGFGPGLAFAPVYELVTGLIYSGLEYERWTTLMTALGAGLILGLVWGFDEAVTWAHERPGYANLRLHGQTLLFLFSDTGHIVVRLVFGLLIGLGAGLQFGLGAGIGGGLVSGLGLLTLRMLYWAEQPTLTSTSTPCSSWQADRTLTLIRTVMSGLVFALMFGLVTGLVGGLAFGLAFGLVAGLVLGEHHAWLICFIAVALLALQRRLPWRVMDLLDDAHRLGLLRAVGPVYQFRHATLHDHLAADASGEARNT
ncbi:NACHT domain-containing protein [Nonomuraea sp. NPDC048881]|uniref:NACHT domain-containing protein n=1 Tax=Nonomuraea sp. NPDC048881 TaxID=3155030 RepID=UPI0033C0F0E0